MMNINHFHSLLRKNGLKNVRNNNWASRQTLEDLLTAFRRKYVKLESQVTAKHKLQRLVFEPNFARLPQEFNQ